MRRLKRAKLISVEGFEMIKTWKRNNKHVNYWQAFDRMLVCLTGEARDLAQALTDHFVFHNDFKFKMYYNVPKN